VEHLAIDLGGRESQICLRGEDGTILEEQRLSTKLLEGLFDRAPARVIVETCAEAFAVADLALARGHQVRVVPAALVKSLGVGARGLKSDRRDARALSAVSCRIDLPSVHVPSHWSRLTKSQCAMRERLVQARTSLVNSVRAWLRMQLKGFRGGAVKKLPARVRQRCQQDWGAVPDFLERMLTSLEFLTGQIEAASKDLAQLAEQNEVCRRLMTVPGVGPITALRFVAALDEVSRFSNAQALQPKTWPMRLSSPSSGKLPVRRPHASITCPSQSRNRRGMRSARRGLCVTTMAAMPRRWFNSTSS
jgi:transposase